MRLSELELSVLEIVWASGECTAPQVHKSIEATRALTYSTVKTIVDRLEAKGAIRRLRQEGRTIYFEAAVEPEDVQQPMLDRLLGAVFTGKRRPLFAQLLSHRAVGHEDLDYLEELIAKKRRELGDD